MAAAFRGGCLSLATQLEQYAKIEGTLPGVVAAMQESAAALRLAAKPAEDMREARDAFLSMICDAHKWQEDVDGDEQDGCTVTWVTYTIVTGHSQLEELANALGIKAPFGETIKATIDLEIEKDIAALSTTQAPKL